MYSASKAKHAPTIRNVNRSTCSRRVVLRSWRSLHSKAAPDAPRSAQSGSNPSTSVPAIQRTFSMALFSWHYLSYCPLQRVMDSTFTSAYTNVFRGRKLFAGHVLSLWSLTITPVFEGLLGRWNLATRVPRRAQSRVLTSQRDRVSTVNRIVLN